MPLNHAEAMRAAGIELSALCDVDPVRLHAASIEHGVAASYTDYALLLRELRPDITGIATRTEGRTVILRAAAVAGVRGAHVEKPFSRTLADTRDALAVTRAAGMRLTYGTTRRFMDVYRTARALVQSGEIGRLREIHVAQGLAPLFWTQAHAADLLVFFSGGAAIEDVVARCRWSGPVSEDLVDDDPLIEFAAIRFAGGLLGIISPADGYTTTLHGEKGSISVTGDGGALEIRRGGDALYWNPPEIRAPAPFMSGTQRAFVELAAALEAGGPSPMEPAEIELGQVLLFAIATSAIRNGVPVRPEDLNPALTITGRSGALYA